MHMYMYVYIYIYREREMCVHISLYTYIYIYIYMDPRGPHHQEPRGFEHRPGHAPPPDIIVIYDMIYYDII